MLVRDLIDATKDLPIGLVDVQRVDIDSRACESGSLFFAIGGGTDHGVHYVHDAVARGAVAVVTSESVTTTIPTVVVPEDQIFNMMVAASYRIVGGVDGVRLIGVTGTNGKTSVTNFIAQLCVGLGIPAATIGTLTSARTTPAPPELARLLRAARETWPRDGVVALEVSSHALDQGRVASLHFEVGVFTNLTHDHLDYHHTMENYFAAKAQLFDVDRSAHAVVCVDSPWGERMATVRSDATTVATADLDDIVVGDDVISFTWRGEPIHARVGGMFNVTNVLLACEAVRALGCSVSDIAKAAATLQSVAGRFEVVSTMPLVIVDYAHTPDGLERVLSDIAVRTRGRVIVVFGCGGDRDTEKRPVMGSIASTLADVVVITNDNPRSEDPATIARAIQSGCHGSADVHVVLDRREAIAQALTMAAAIDVVIIAGKGHEKTQETNGFVVDFDDVAVVRELLNR